MKQGSRVVASLSSVRELEEGMETARVQGRENPNSWGIKAVMKKETQEEV